MTINITNSAISMILYKTNSKINMVITQPPFPTAKRKESRTIQLSVYSNLHEKIVYNLDSIKNYQKSSNNYNYLDFVKFVIEKQSVTVQ